MRTSVQIIKFIYVLKDRISFSRWRRYIGHVILADSSPILFRLISNTEVHCLVDVPGQKVPSIANREIANYLKTIVAPQGASGIIFPIIKSEGVRQMYFPAMVAAYYKAPQVA
ncbi:putative squalene monooxygenase [Helianthus debilis subsp. tardiflorus]